MLLRHLPMALVLIFFCEPMHGQAQTNFPPARPAGRTSEYRRSMESIDRSAVARTAEQQRLVKGEGIGVILTSVYKVRQEMNFPNGSHGAIVTEVIANSPASEAGIRPGDIISEVNSGTIRNEIDVTQAISGLLIRTNGAGPLVLTMQDPRGGVARKIAVPLKPKPVEVKPGRDAYLLVGLSGNQPAALYALSMATFADKSCTQLFTNWPRVNELLAAFNTDATWAKSQKNFQMMLDQMKSDSDKIGTIEFCNQMISATYLQDFGGQRITGIVRRR